MTDQKEMYNISDYILTDSMQFTFDTVNLNI